MRPKRLPAIVVVAGLVALTACSSGRAPAAKAGLAACIDEPDTCNAGDRAAGGQITWLVEQGWSRQWNTMRPGGASFYLSQVLAGTTPVIGHFTPAGQWSWNRDLFASEPRLVRDEPQTMAYQLRQEAVWSDGTPIGLDDFLFNWFHNSGRPDHCQGCDPADTTGWAEVGSIASTGDRTVTITYRPGVRDPEWFAHFGPSHLPAHVALRAGHDWRSPAGMGAASAFFRDTPPTWSGGPYLIDSVVTDQRAILVPNPRWYGREPVTLARIVKEVVTSQADWPAAVANGELDGGAPLSVDLDVVERLGSSGQLSTAIGSAGATWEHVDLNLGNPWLADLALRRAIFTAIDTGDARTRLFGDRSPPLRTNHLFSAGSPHHKDLLAGSRFGTGDLATARRILADAGYTGSEPGGRLARNGAAVDDLRFVFLAGHPTRGTFVQIAQERLRQIGITITPVAVPGPQFGRALVGGDFDLVILAFDGGPLFTQGPAQLFGSTSGVNFSRLAVPEIDRAADAVLDQVDVGAAAAKANEVVALVMAQASMLPLWDNLSFAFVRNGYVNVRDNLQSPLRAMYNIGSWGVAADR